MTFPPRVHLLQSVHQPTHFGFQQGNKSFVLGFLRSSDVVYTTRVITKNVKGSLLGYQSRNVADIVNEGLLEMGVPRQMEEIRVQELALVQVSKEPSPYFDWMIDTIPTDYFITYPFSKGIGIVLATSKAFETDSDIVYHCQVVEPVEDTELFRKNLRM